MTAQPSVSIVTPTYNRAHLLRRVWDSLSRQTVPDFQWIVVDDGSSDGTAELLAALADPRIRCVRQANQGVNAARARGEREAAAPYVIFLDSDDELHGENALRTMLDEIRRAPPRVGVVYFGVVDGSGREPLYRVQGNRVVARYEDHVCETLFSGEFFPIYRRECLALAPWPVDVGGLECLRHWSLARHCDTLLIDTPTRVYHRAEGDNLTGAQATVRRAAGMAAALRRLIAEHRAAWLDLRPTQLGRYTFFLAMYEALSGTGAPLRNLADAARWGDAGIRRRCMALTAAMLLPPSWRRQLFVWQASRRRA